MDVKPFHDVAEDALACLKRQREIAEQEETVEKVARALQEDS